MSLSYNKFLRYHYENPEIYVMFVRFASEAIRSGREHFGAQAIFERMRWHTQIEARNDAFKINNNYVAFYARMFEEKNPQYSGFFRKRESVADNMPNSKQTELSLT